MEDWTSLCLCGLHHHREQGEFVMPRCCHLPLATTMMGKSSVSPFSCALEPNLQAMANLCARDRAKGDVFFGGDVLFTP